MVRNCYALFSFIMSFLDTKGSMSVVFINVWFIFLNYRTIISKTYMLKLDVNFFQVSTSDEGIKFWCKIDNYYNSYYITVQPYSIKVVLL